MIFDIITVYYLSIAMLFMQPWGKDKWRGPKVINSPQLSVIISHFGLKIARIAIADTIFITILQKRENRRNDSPFDNIKMQGQIKALLLA